MAIRRWADGLRPNSIGSLMLHLGTRLKAFDENELYTLATSKLEGATVRSLAARLYVAEKELAVARYEAEHHATRAPEPEHAHVFNPISGYCRCGLQYAPHLLEHFEHGGLIGNAPPAWMADDRRQFVTRLPPGSVIADLPLYERWNVIEGDHDLSSPSDAERHSVMEGAR